MTTGSSERLSFQNRLFISIDVVGSTAYKSRRSSTREDFPIWLEFFRRFYESYPEQLEEKCKALNIEKLTLWKTLGDELVFETIISNHLTVSKYLEAARSVAHGYVKTLRAEGIPLSLKLTAWLAGFPVINTRIALPDGRDEYIGPSVDTGFRLSKFSSPSRFAISVEVAYIVAASTEHGFEVYFDDFHELKGVLGGRPYPVFWIDMKYEFDKHANKLIAAKKVPDLNSIREFCDAFVKEIDDPTVLVLPYFTEDNETLWNSPPERHAELFDRMRHSAQNTGTEQLKSDMQTLPTQQEKTVEPGIRKRIVNVESDPE